MKNLTTTKTKLILGQPKARKKLASVMRGGSGEISYEDEHGKRQRVRLVTSSTAKSRAERVDA